MFRPPGDVGILPSWHLVDTPHGRKLMQWRPGIEVWKDQAGYRFTAELAGDHGWRYVGPAT